MQRILVCPPRADLWPIALWPVAPGPSAGRLLHPGPLAPGPWPMGLARGCRLGALMEPCTVYLGAVPLQRNPGIHLPPLLVVVCARSTELSFNTLF